MQRHPWLVPFSREHHSVLHHALRLRRATPETAQAVREGFTAFWSEHGTGHFDREEAVVLPALDPDHPLVVRVLGDHERIAARVEELSSPGPVDLSVLHQLGEALTAHVRLEERELFPLVERELEALA